MSNKDKKDVFIGIVGENENELEKAEAPTRQRVREMFDRRREMRIEMDAEIRERPGFVEMSKFTEELCEYTLEVLEQEFARTGGYKAGARQKASKQENPAILSELDRPVPPGVWSTLILHSGSCAVVDMYHVMIQENIAPTVAEFVFKCLYDKVKRRTEEIRVQGTPGFLLETLEGLEVSPEEYATDQILIRDRVLGFIDKWGVEFWKRYLERKLSTFQGLDPAQVIYYMTALRASVKSTQTYLLKAAESIIEKEQKKIEMQEELRINRERCKPVKFIDDDAPQRKQLPEAKQKKKVNLTLRQQALFFLFLAYGKFSLPEQQTVEGFAAAIHPYTGGDREDLKDHLNTATDYKPLSQRGGRQSILKRISDLEVVKDQLMLFKRNTASIDDEIKRLKNELAAD